MQRIATLRAREIACKVGNPLNDVGRANNTRTLLVPNRLQRSDFCAEPGSVDDAACVYSAFLTFALLLCLLNAPPPSLFASLNSTIANEDQQNMYTDDYPVALPAVLAF